MNVEGNVQLERSGLKLPENCPVCGKKMEKGYVAANFSIWWTKKPGKWTTKVEEILLGKSFLGVYAESYRCLDCKIALFGYGKETASHGYDIQSIIRK